MFNVEVLESGVSNELEKAAILSYVLDMSEFVTVRIGSLVYSDNYILISNNNIGIYMLEADDDLYELYYELYEIFKTRECSCYNNVKAKHEFKVIEMLDEDNVKVYDVEVLDDIKYGSEISLKNISFISFEDDDKFEQINKVLPLRVDAIITFGEFINLFSKDDIDIDEEQMIFAALNYNSEEVKALYNKFKKWGKKNA